MVENPLVVFATSCKVSDVILQSNTVYVELQKWEAEKLVAFATVSVFYKQLIFLVLRLKKIYVRCKIVTRLN